jgi:thiamine biosynthesis lipoprotein
MKQTEIIMGMPITIICDQVEPMAEVFDFFRGVDAQYSPYIASSIVGKMNRDELSPKQYNQEFRAILNLADETKRQTNGYFDVWHKGVFDPSGIVKGWAIQKAAELMSAHSQHFYIEAGGDIQVLGHSPSGTSWRLGVRNPFDRTEIIANVELSDGAIATSGTAIRGQHIYNPHTDAPADDVVSISVVGPRIVDADRFATAAFAMGRDGINFIARLPRYAGYMVDKDGIATMTPGWQNYAR